jgi:hypothetical protein
MHSLDQLTLSVFDVWPGIEMMSGMFVTHNKRQESLDYNAIDAQIAHYTPQRFDSNTEVVLWPLGHFLVLLQTTCLAQGRSLPEQG